MKMNRERNIILTAFLVVMISAGTLWANPGITVSGYEVLNLKAGQEIQHVNFRNPESNSCYMKLTLIQDGTALWTSELIEPGSSVTEISLNHALSAGTYNAVLRHEFFALNDKTQLNGLNISLKLKVE